MRRLDPSALPMPLGAHGVSVTCPPAKFQKYWALTCEGVRSQSYWNALSYCVISQTWLQRKFDRHFILREITIWGIQVCTLYLRLYLVRSLVGGGRLSLRKLEDEPSVLDTKAFELDAAGCRQGAFYLHWNLMDCGLGGEDLRSRVPFWRADRWVQYISTRDCAVNRLVAAPSCLESILNLFR